MRIFFAFILSAIVSLSSMQAQTKTYDIKYPRIYTDDPTGFGNFQQISSTRLLCGARTGGGWAFLLAIDNDGMIVHKWKSSFKVSSQQSLYRYDKNSNTLVYIATELISIDTHRIRLVLLDSNLKEKSNVILDSSVTGMSTIFNDRTGFTGITLRDSSIVWMSYFLTTKYIKGLEQTVLHLSKDGKIISRTSIADTNRYNGTIPLLQMPSGKILYSSAEYDPTIKKYTGTLVTSDTLYNFDVNSVIGVNDFRRGADDIISTKDSGIILAYYSNDSAIIIKYDKNFNKQWTTSAPAGSVQSDLDLIESQSGGYYITTEGNDTVALNTYPQFKDYPDCFQDIILSRIDTSGKVLFSAYYGTEMCNERPFDMMQDYTDGGIIITGWYNDNRNNSPCETLCERSNTNWFFKVDSLGNPSKRTAVTGVNEINNSVHSIVLYPNPTSGILTVDFGQLGYFTTIEIISLDGNILQSGSIESSSSSLKVNISNFPSGNYYCRLKAPFHSVTRPFIIQK